jgi:hypothetical protein
MGNGLGTYTNGVPANRLHPNSIQADRLAGFGSVELTAQDDHVRTV